MDAQHGWQRMLTHGGRIIAELTLARTTPGGPRPRPVQSGMRANWRHAGPDQVPVEGPVVLLDDTRRSIRPGEIARVAIYPLLPQLWDGVSAGSELDLVADRGLVIGRARVLEVIDLPQSAELDLNWSRPDGRTPGVPLERRRLWGRWSGPVRGAWFRRRG